MRSSISSGGADSPLNAGESFPVPALRTRRFWAVYTAAWVAYAGLFGFGVASEGVDVDMAVLGAVGNVIVPGLLGIALLRFQIPSRWTGSGAWFRLAATVGTCLGFVALATLGTELVFLLLRPLYASRTEWTFNLVVLVWRSIMNVLAFVVLASVQQAIVSSARLRVHERRTARAEALRARAELEALRARFNPHFVFNTLHSLIALVRTDPERAEQAIEEVAALIRYASRLQRSQVDEVPLEEEWRFAENYLALESLRLGDRLRVRHEIDPAAMDAPVPVFTLQPLVENAVRHAVAPRADGGTIAITGTTAGSHLELHVSDDGPGNDLRAVDASSGQGLRLLRQRLTALYEDRAELRIETSPGGGFHVSLRLPLDSEAHPDDGGAGLADDTVRTGPTEAGADPHAARNP
jgi:two-component sensor histidine kinase